MFQPIVIGTGLVAWRNLQRTLPDQLAAFSQGAEQERLTSEFKEKASSLTSADAVVEDRQVLRVALGAYGLQDDLDNRYFINRILSEGTTDDDALANRMADSRYERLASDFALDGLSQFVGILPSKAEEITEQFNAQSFALAVGDVNENLRLALNAETELSRIAELDTSDDAKWYLVMGNAPLRSVIESALSLPSSFAQLDIDTQLDVFREKALSAFGVEEIDELAGDEVKAKVIDLFLLKEQLNEGQSLSSQNIALQLLQA
jgi:hypothetical protein